MAGPSSDAARQAYVTLVTNDNYGYGALVLGHSLKESGTQRALVVLVTDSVTLLMRRRLSDVWRVVLVRELNSNDADRLALLNRPELGVTFTKIFAWLLTDYDKCVFLDADTLVVQNSDALFDLPELSAAPDIGWPDCFNSGVFVFVPSNATFERLAQMAATEGSFDGGDQGLLNQAWSDWATADIKRHISFLYNMNPNAYYSYLPAFERFGSGVRILHFIGHLKPWNLHRSADGRVLNTPGVSKEHAQMWWDIYDRYFEKWATEAPAAAGPVAQSPADSFKGPAEHLLALTERAQTSSTKKKGDSIPWASPFELPPPVLEPPKPEGARGGKRRADSPSAQPHPSQGEAQAPPSPKKIEPVFSPSPLDVPPPEPAVDDAGQPLTGFALVQRRLDQMMRHGAEEAAAIEAAKRARERVRRVEHSIASLQRRVEDVKRSIATAAHPEVVEEVCADIEGHIRMLEMKLGVLALTQGEARLEHK